MTALLQERWILRFWGCLGEDPLSCNREARADVCFYWSVACDVQFHLHFPQDTQLTFNLPNNGAEAQRWDMPSHNQC